MSRDDIRGVIEDQLRDTPNRSDRAIARALGVDHKTVGAVRKGRGGELPHLREGQDGKTYRIAQRPGGDNAALPDSLKIALFDAGLSAHSTTVMRGDPFGHPPLEPHEESAWTAFGQYLSEWGWPASAVSDHLNYVVGHKNFRTPDEWLGEDGRRFRAREGRPEPSAEFLDGWRRRSRESPP
jgi:hypothetical protein